MTLFVIVPIGCKIFILKHTRPYNFNLFPQIGRVTMKEVVWATT